MFAQIAVLFALVAVGLGGYHGGHGGTSKQYRKQDLLQRCRKVQGSVLPVCVFRYDRKHKALHFSAPVQEMQDYGHYRFGYDIVNGYGAVNGRHEAGAAYGPVHGSYYLGDIDGRHRRVEYVADKLGFRAVVKTNEPGTKTSLPAAAPYLSAHGKNVPAYGHGGYGYHG